MADAKAGFKRGSAGVFARRRQQLSQALQRLAEQGADDAELHAKKGLMLNVYGTARGRYERTGHLLGQVYADGHANSTSLGVQVGDRAEYASQIEYGSGPHELSPQQLKKYLDVLPPSGLLQFGRSGKAYLLPGPYVGPAIYLARLRTTQRMQVLMQELWK